MKSIDKNNTLKKSFSLIGLVGVSVCVVIFTVIQFIFMDDIYAFAAKITLLDSSRVIAAMDFSDESYKPKLSDFEANKSIYVEIYSPRDVLIYTSESNNIIDTDNSKEQLSPRYMKIISHSDRKDGSYFEIREEAFATARYIVYGSSFGNDKALVIYYSLDSINENAETASWTLFGLSIIALLIYFGVMYYFAWAFTKPLEIINSATKKITDLDFSQNCPKFKVKELDELSDNINTLSMSLKNALDNLKSENKQLESDIERERALDKSRRTFVANASHELKTPISIIQGYAEGMKYGIGCDSTEEFCDIIIEESNKMNELVVKLMELVHYGTSYQLKASAFNLTYLINEHIYSIENTLEDKDIKIIVDFPEKLMCYGDPTLINIVISNYVSNALSHVDFEKKIIISLEEKNDCFRIKVFNTGKQIPGTDINNIWQSFYRADKSHSRAEGHFGLGLPLVMSIQELHKADFGVANKQNGVEFWFDIKKA